MFEFNAQLPLEIMYFWSKYSHKIPKMCTNKCIYLLPNKEFRAGTCAPIAAGGDWWQCCDSHPLCKRPASHPGRKRYLDSSQICSRLPKARLSGASCHQAKARGWVQPREPWVHRAVGRSVWDVCVGDVRRGDCSRDLGWCPVSKGTEPKDSSRISRCSVLHSLPLTDFPSLECTRLCFSFFLSI